MHDDGLDAARDALNDAVDDLLAGAPADDVAARLAPELRPLLDAGSRLARHRASGDGPRPGFVVGLGEQLRMDMRLSMARPDPLPAETLGEPTAESVARRSSPLRPRAWWSIALAGVVFGFLAGVVVRSGDARPGEPLYPIKRGVEHLELRAEPNAMSRVESRLDQAWRRLAELRQLVQDGTGSDDSVLTLVDDLLTAYDDVLTLAGAVDNDIRALRRARADADAAAVELDRLAVGLGPPVGAALARAGRHLRLSVAAVPAAYGNGTPAAEPPRALPGGEDRSSPGLPSPTEPSGQAPPSPAPSAPPEPPTSEPTRAPTPTLPTPTPTPVPPTPTDVPTATMPPAEPPPGATTPLPQSTSTPAPPRSTATRIVPATAWPTVLVAPTSTAVMPDPPTASPPPATATRPLAPTTTPMPTASPTHRSSEPPPPPPPTISPPTSTPVGEAPTPKPPPTDPANPTATPPPLPSATAIDPGAQPGEGRRRDP